MSDDDKKLGWFEWAGLVLAMAWEGIKGVPLFGPPPETKFPDRTKDDPKK